MGLAAEFCLALLSPVLLCAQAAPQQREWAWMGGSYDALTVAAMEGNFGVLGVPSASNIPSERQNPGTWIDSQGNLWLFGGMAPSSSTNSGFLNDLWEYSPATGEWVWVSGSSTGGQAGVYGVLRQAAKGNVPGGRYGAVTWIDQSGNLWLFGGEGRDATGTASYLNDLWEFNPATGLWAWVSGNNVSPAAMYINDPPGWPGNYGTLNSPSTTTMPGGRAMAAGWLDKSGKLWLFGGIGYGASGQTDILNDLWKYDPTLGTDGEWTWMGGSQTTGASGVYGTEGQPSSGNYPGSRSQSASWTDRDGNFWLFGGDGVDATGASGYMNDLWEFNPSSGPDGAWTWVSGSSTLGTAYCYEPGLECGQPSLYAAQGQFAPGNVPSGRFGATGVPGSDGDFWLFGGYQEFNPGQGENFLNDLWEFDPGTQEWAWIGSSPAEPQPCQYAPGGSCLLTGADGVYGNLGFPSASGAPGGRYWAATWGDSYGNLWIFGGNGLDGDGNFLYLNDFWEYAFTAATPTINPAGGTFTAVQSVTISDTTPGANIYYTTDGTLPGASSNLYSGTAISVSSKETIYAIAIAPGYFNSEIASAVFDINLPTTATPSFSPAAGTYTSAQQVAISDATPGAVIYYSINSVPSTSSAQYSGPITVSSSETIETIAVAAAYLTSAAASATYTINLPAAMPSFSPAAGTYTSAQTVSISDATPGATVYYTTNGSTPTAGSTPYTGPITVSSSETIEAIAVASGYSASAVASATYTINLPAAIPSFSPAAGTYSSAQTVSISDATPGATVYYTTNGSTPTANSTPYTGPITVSSSETIEAIAVASDYSSSPVASATYTINLPTTATPAINPPSGTYTSAQTVTITDSTPGAAIYYTVSGSGSSTQTGTPYTGPIVVSSSESIQAFAAAPNYLVSSSASADYIINLATPTFTLAASRPSLALASGGQGTIGLIVTPQNGFNSTVSFLCTGLPAGANCSFSPTTVTPSGGAAATTTLTITAQTLTASAPGGSRPLLPAAALALSVCILGWKKRRISRLLLLAVAAAGLGLLSGCSASLLETPVPTNSTVIVTASSGAIQQSATISLTVN